MKLVIEVKEEDYKRYKEDKICSYTSAVLDAVPLNEVLDKISAELHATAEMHEDENYYLRDEWIDEIIDKYRTGSNETQTNEIIYDVGGHMYGVMGGDVIMDILAGKDRD